MDGYKGWIQWTNRADGYYGCVPVKCRRRFCGTSIEITWIQWMDTAHGYNRKLKLAWMDTV